MSFEGWQFELEILDPSDEVGRARVSWPVAALECIAVSREFSSPMTTHAASQVWQDVYHRVAPNGKVAYVKVTLRADGSIVIQFKEK